MTKWIMIATLLLLNFSLAKAEDGDLSHRINGKPAPDRQDIQDNIREYACDCCQKCKAARRPVQPDLQKDGGVQNNGCRECCQRCGRPVQPSPEEIPPEIIQKPRQK